MNASTLKQEFAGQLSSTQPLMLLFIGIERNQTMRVRRVLTSQFKELLGVWEICTSRQDRTDSIPRLKRREGNNG